MQADEDRFIAELKYRIGHLVFEGMRAEAARDVALEQVAAQAEAIDKLTAELRALRPAPPDEGKPSA